MVLAILDDVTTTPLGDARDHLAAYVADVERTHNRVTITRYGRPAAVLISAEELESLDETVDILSTPHALEQIQAAAAEIDRGEYVRAEDIDRILEERRTGGGR